MLYPTAYIVTDRTLSPDFLTRPATFNLTLGRYLAGNLDDDDSLDLLERGVPLNIKITGILKNEPMFQWLQTVRLGTTLLITVANDEVTSIGQFQLSEIFQADSLKVELRAARIYS